MPANAIDLTNIANVKNWAGVLTTNDDQIVQDIVTAFSGYVLQLTARGNSDGSVPTGSPFVTPQNYDEIYDGNGNDRLPLNNWPVTAITSVNDTGVPIPQSTSMNQPGWVIDQSHKFLVLRGGGFTNLTDPRRVAGRFFRGRVGFTLGTQNVEVVYSAGFAAVPQDLEMVARKVCGLNYKRRQWIGQRSQAMAAGAGTVSYTDWEMDAQDTEVIKYYMARTAGGG